MCIPGLHKTEAGTQRKEEGNFWEHSQTAKPTEK